MLCCRLFRQRSEALRGWARDGDVDRLGDLIVCQTSLLKPCTAYQLSNNWHISKDWADHRLIAIYECKGLQKEEKHPALLLANAKM
jgi:hypothetical protein